MNSGPEPGRADQSTGDVAGMFAQALIAGGALVVLLGWESFVGEIAPPTWVPTADGSIEVPNAPRVIGTLVAPAVVLSGVGLWLLGRQGGPTLLGAAASIAGGALALTAVLQVVAGLPGFIAAAAGGVVLALVATRRARVGLRAAGRTALVAAAPLPLAIAVILLGVVSQHPLGVALLGDPYQSTGHHEFTASVPYVGLKLLGWLVLAGACALAAARFGRRTLGGTFRVVAGVVAAVGVGEAVLGSVRLLVFERSPLEPWLGAAVELLVAASLVAVAVRGRTLGYLVGSLVAIANALVALNKTYLAPAGQSVVVAASIEGGALMLIGLGLILWRGQTSLPPARAT